MSNAVSGATPLMQQYFAMKEQCPDALLLFQVGDFYELFLEDAQKASVFLGIALTKRGTHNGEPIPLCGVPMHALDHYLIKLVRGGFKIAVCDQLEQAVPGTVVKRGITQVLTPGTLTDTRMLDEKSASYVLTFFPLADAWGLVFSELMTAQLFATVVPVNEHRQLEAELARFSPDEIVLPGTSAGKQFERYFKQMGYFVTLEREGRAQAVRESAQEWMRVQFGNQTCEQITAQEPVEHALTTLYGYLSEYQAATLGQFRSLRLYAPDEYVQLDAATQRNLELTCNTQDGSRAHTLLAILDRAVTPMGSRMIKKWITRPLIKRDDIELRQAAVRYFVQDVIACQRLIALFGQLGDCERVIGRIALGRAQAHDYHHLNRALAVLPEIHEILAAGDGGALLAHCVTQLGEFGPLRGLLHAALNADAHIEALIKPGFDQELDRLRSIADNAHHTILALEATEQEATGIGSLKIGYNQVHGYYIEVTKVQSVRVPERYIRQQTLAGRERYTTPELQQLQTQIETARREWGAFEQQVFARLTQEVFAQVAALRRCAQALAVIDALVGFARTAYDQGYVQPQFVEGHDITIVQGRHPVVEQTLRTGFTPNTVRLTERERVWIITGPNMGGKSTFMRQVALICIMAHCGSFVPAQSAQIPLLDRIFTRIGAGDQLAQGKSTFLVEMEEVATICAQATERSLVILDEVGRGTSTIDGVAIAQGVVEYLYEHAHARTLFATHYHELAALPDMYPGIAVYHAASKKGAQGILFLHAIEPGAADGSFGIDVAQLAGVPETIIARAQELAAQLAGRENGFQEGALSSLVGAQRCSQVDSVDPERERIMSELRKIDYEGLSPRAAFDVLWRIRELL